MPHPGPARDNREKLQKERQRRIAILQRHIQADNVERLGMVEQHATALSTCLVAYADSMATGDSHDTVALFRLVALWYKSAHATQVNDTVCAVVAAPQSAGSSNGARTTLPSAKFLPLVWQLVARLEPLEDDATGFQRVLHALVSRIAKDHPYHSLYQLMALRAAGTVGTTLLANAPTTKIKAAQTVLEGVRDSSSRLANILAQMETVVHAYSKVPLIKVTEAMKISQSIQLPSDVRNIGEQPLVPIITAPPDVDRTCTYPQGSFAYFKAFTGNATLVGGINAPRKIVTLGSDGRHYTQLAKGCDDLRQDAVMQQVFGHANALLSGAPGARARALHVNTYRVIPFNPLAGLVEWVEDTTPLGEWLFIGKGSPSAHRRLRPEDMSHTDAQNAMRYAAENNPAELRTTFDSVCDRYKPVLHHFFLERFPTAALWYERRLAYTRSLAVSSMVGYIIGLGDRHSSNILIGCSSAELVHIDLGVAFEQGKLLPTPELVPFRLTRDIVDGCGAAGVQGVMRRCCEETLAVLRANKESLLTLVEVLIHDPILKWAMSPAQARRRQQPRAGEADLDAGADDDAAPSAFAAADMALLPQGAADVQNADAERALLRVRQKLDGIEGGEPRSVEGQVQQLIQDARDPDKLCRMYFGWAAWA